MIIDTHAHYDDEAFDEDREQLLASLGDHNIGLVLDVGSTKESLPKIRELISKYDLLYGAIGLHPDEIGDLTPELLQQMRQDMENPKVVAVGEIGLDYYWNKEAKELQKEAFRQQIRLAQEFGKPVVIHSREAAADTLEIVQEMYGKGSPWETLYGAATSAPKSSGQANSADRKTVRKGVMHCYSYSVEHARIYTRELGFYLGIGGVVTFKNAKKLREVVADTPFEYLLLETDCPYLAPVPYRGKRNNSLYLPYVVQAIAEIKGVAPEEVERVTEENARRLFGF
ncbi:MAG: TatD family hydrolase [Lachnospiraceae bacterium]|nr:TatD family hydrolase [Lachnospiraceae bacterium]